MTFVATSACIRAVIAAPITRAKYSQRMNGRTMAANRTRESKNGFTPLWSCRPYCRVCPRRFIVKARQIGFGSIRRVCQNNVAFNANDAQGRSARVKFVQMFAELQTARCEMKKRVSLNDRPIMMNRHVSYVGREMRHPRVENVVLKQGKRRRMELPDYRPDY